MYAHVYLDVLQVLLEAGDFPSSILKATGKDILNLFEHGNGLELVLESSNIDVLGIQKKARSGIHRRSENGEYPRLNCNERIVLKSVLRIIFRHANRVTCLR
jgi:hypothetical protein